jgi:hypothetical protein
LNVLTVADSLLLLVASAGGTRVHVATAAEFDGIGRGAVPDHWFEPDTHDLHPGLQSYDQDELKWEGWSERTLCGRSWLSMCSTDRGLLHLWTEVAHAPSCKRCLALLDRKLPAATPSVAIDRLVGLVLTALDEEGLAEIIGTPGNQLTLLRSAIVRGVRARYGWSCRTHVHASMLVVECEEAYDRHADRHSLAAADAIGSYLDGAGPRVDSSGWRFHWSAWS